MRLRWLRRNSAGWDTCANLVRDRYAREYSANIEPDPTLFAALARSNDSLTSESRVAVAGLTFASANEALFCEHYLDAPVEEVVAVTTSSESELSREGIVEVGPLATSSSGLGDALIRMIPSLCWCRGATSVVCTVSPSVSAQIRSVGIDLRTVGPAYKSRLPVDMRQNWGTYYDAGAEVAVIDLTQQGEELIKARIAPAVAR